MLQDPEITEHTKDSSTIVIQTLLPSLLETDTTPKPARETTTVIKDSSKVSQTIVTMTRHVADTSSGSQHMSESTFVTAFIQNIKSVTATPSSESMSTATPSYPKSIKTNNVLQTAGKIDIFMILFSVLMVVCGTLIIVIVQCRTIKKKKKYIPPKQYSITTCSFHSNESRIYAKVSDNDDKETSFSHVNWENNDNSNDNDTIFDRYTTSDYEMPVSKSSIRPKNNSELYV